MRTRRPFKAFLAWDKEAGKVNFEFTPSKFPRKERPKRPAFVRSAAAERGKGGAKRTAKPKRAPKDPNAPKAPRKSGGKVMTVSPELAAVIGSEPVARTQVIKKLWDYIKANGLQDATNKRAINADAILPEDFQRP